MCSRLTNQNKIFPSPLKPGDLLRVIAPSGVLREIAALEQSVEIWRSHGYRVEICPEIHDQWGYLAGKDETRLRELKAAWSDPNCQGILCARGGFGSTRILELGQVPSLRTSPPWLIGFSDITALLWNLYKRGFSSAHAPVLTTLANEPDWSIERLFDLLEGRSLAPLRGDGWGGGIVSGRLLPGNLTVATHLLGTPILPDLDGVILAWEDVTEAPYRIDRMLTQWRLSGVLAQVGGIALGGFTKCESPAHLPSFNIEEVLRDRLGDLGIPIVSNLPFGHDHPNAALPVGGEVILDADKGILKFM